MNVGELKKMLEDYPDDMDVVVDTEYGCNFVVELSLEPVSFVYRHKGNHYICWPKEAVGIMDGHYAPQIKEVKEVSCLELKW